MGGCFSKKKEREEDDPSSSPRTRGAQKKTAVMSSRNPPPTELPQEEEKVKEVLSETPKITGNNKKKKDSDSDRGRDTLVDRPEVSEELSAPSTTLSENTATTITRAAVEDDEEGEEEIEMKKMRPAVTRSRSPAKLQKKINRSDRPASVGKREIRGVDVGCRSARSSPSPTMVREKGNVAARNRITSSAAAGQNNCDNYCNYKRSDIEERSGRRSLSPAMKRSVSAAPAMDQRKWRSSTRASTTATRANINGRFSPQRVPPPPLPRVMHLEDARRGQDGKNGGAAGGEDGNVLENPLVSMECFIFL